LEIELNGLYQENGLYRAMDLQISRVSRIFSIQVHYYSGKCMADWEDREDGYHNAIILLNEKDDEETTREKFFHELCHPLKHVGIQHKLPTLIRELQENQASQFQLYASMPIYMIQEYIDQSPTLQILEKNLAEAFCLPISLVKRRLFHISNRIFWGRIDRSYKHPQPKVVITAERIKLVQEDFARKFREENRGGN
jgi:Zn-dependent peptidase ImmA (M78 family)